MMLEETSDSVPGWMSKQKAHTCGSYGDIFEQWSLRNQECVGAFPLIAWSSTLVASKW